MIQRAKEIYQNEGFFRLATSSARFVRLELSNFIAKPISNRIFDMRYGTGESIFDFDWDNLIILDACRYDEFVRQSPFPDNEIEPRISVASKTPGFLEETFSNGEFHDTVYVTANPQVLKYISKRDIDRVFYSTISVLDEWDSETQTILPEDVKIAAIRAEREYPNKRIIVHFLQPHAPFIGDKAREIRNKTGKTIGGLDPGREYTDVASRSITTTGYREMLQNHDVSEAEIVSAYRESLVSVLDHVGELIDELKGKTAITADHGELLGDRPNPISPKRWEHPPGYRTKELCEVPWVEFEDGERKKIIEETPPDTDDFDRREIKERLRSLGYTE